MKSYTVSGPLTRPEHPENDLSMQDGITPDLGNVPPELRRPAQWVAWREEFRQSRYDERYDRYVGAGKAKKKPYRLTPPYKAASTSDAGTWGTFEDAHALVARAHPGATGGVGFVITEDDPLCCLDFDDAIDSETGEIVPEVARIVDEFGSYAELSPSSTGLHVWIFGTKPGIGTKATVCDGVTVEIYDANQFVTVTGKVVRPGPVQERQEALDALYERFFPEVEPTADGAHGGREGGFSGDDEDLLKRARSAKTGAEFSVLHDDGDLSLTDGDHSGADFKLCWMYAFWTGRDAERMDKLFRLSALYRDKWDEVHYSDGATYGEGTIRAATAACKNVYRPGRAAPEADVSMTMDAVEGEIWRRIMAGEWKGNSKKTDVSVTLTLLRLGRERGEMLPTGCVRVPVSFRDLAAEAKVRERTVTRYAGRIKRTGLVRQDVSEGPGKAGAFVLVPPKGTPVKSVHTVSTRGRYTLPVDSVDTFDIPDELTPLRYSASGVKRAGKGGELVVRLLQRSGTPLTRKELEDATGIRADKLRSGTLRYLESWGVVVHEPRADTYRLSSDWKERYAAMREHGGELLQDEAQSASRAWDRAAYQLHNAEILHARKPCSDTRRRLKEAQSALAVATEAREENRKAYREFLDSARLRPAGVADPLPEQGSGAVQKALYPDSIPSGEAFGIPTASVSHEPPASLAADPGEDEKEMHMGMLFMGEGFLIRHYAHEVSAELPPELAAAIKLDDPATRGHPDDCECLGCGTLLPDLPRYARDSDWPARKVAVPEDAPPEKDYAPCAA